MYSPDALLLPPDILTLLNELEDLPTFVTTVVAQGNANLHQAVTRLEDANAHTSALLTNLVSTTHSRLLRAAANINKLPNAIKEADGKVDNILQLSIKLRDRLPKALESLQSNLQRWQSLMESEELLLLIRMFIKEVNTIRDEEESQTENADPQLAKALHYTRIADLLGKEMSREALSRVCVLQSTYARVLRDISSIEDEAIDSLQKAILSHKIDEVALRSSIARLACVNAVPKGLLSASVLLQKSLHLSLETSSSLSASLDVFRKALQRAVTIMSILKETSRAKDALELCADIRLSLWRFSATHFASWIEIHSEAVHNDMTTFIRLSEDVYHCQDELEKICYEVPLRKDELSDLSVYLRPAEARCIDDFFQGTRSILAMLFPRVAAFNGGRSFVEVLDELRRERPTVTQTPTRADVLKVAMHLNSKLSLLTKTSKATAPFRDCASKAVECFSVCLRASLTESELHETEELNFELGITAITATHKARAVLELLFHTFLKELQQVDPTLLKSAQGCLMRPIDEWARRLFEFYRSAIDVLCTLSTTAQKDALQMLQTFHTAVGEVADVYFQMLWPIDELAEAVTQSQTKSIRYFLMVFARSPLGRSSDRVFLESLLELAAAFLTRAVPRGVVVEVAEWAALEDFARVMLRDERIFATPEMQGAEWSMSIKTVTILNADYLAYLLLLRVLEKEMPELPTCDLTSIGCVVSTYLDTKTGLAGNELLAGAARACARANMSEVLASDDEYTKRAAEVLMDYVGN